MILGLLIMVKITTLMDNSVGSAGTTAEHGLSFFIEKDGQSILFDTGNSGAFLKNARLLGTDITDVKNLVVSHGHWDHAGGVNSLIKIGGFTGILWTGPGFFNKKWNIEKEKPRYLGVNFSEEELSQAAITHSMVSGTENKTEIQEILPGLFAVNGFARIHSEEEAIPKYAVDRKKGRMIDDFRDEVCLAIDLPGGVAVVLGCAHPGLMNMLDSVKAVFGKPVRGVFGGSHLVNADSHRINTAIDYLTSQGCELAALGHCTGKAGTEALKKLSFFRPLAVGEEFIL